MKIKWWERIILKITHRVWNRRISLILLHAYSTHIINSGQLHSLAAKFDSTQDHEVY